MVMQYGQKFIKENIHGINKRNSTNNAALTELIPCILFNINELYNQEINEEFINKIISYINESKIDIFLENKNKETALKIFKEININDNVVITKINSGKQIYKLMKQILQKREITFEKIYWCYRKKPEGVSVSNPSDVIILGIDEKKNEKYLGFSFKSGKIKSENSKTESKEPKLNSYVLPMLKLYNDNVLEDFYIKFNLKMQEIFSKSIDFNSIDFPLFQPKNLKNLNDWNNYKKENSMKLFNVNLNDIKFRSAQTMIKDFFIELFNNDKKHFKNIFINKCLGVMNTQEQNEENDNFFENGFYVLKGDEKYYKSNENINEAKIITPDIKKYLQTDLSEIKIVNTNSVQSFNVYFGDDKYIFSIHTSDGKSCLELPNLRFATS